MTTTKWFGSALVLAGALLAAVSPTAASVAERDTQSGASSEASDQNTAAATGPSYVSSNSNGGTGTVADSGYGHQDISNGSGVDGGSQAISDGATTTSGNTQTGSSNYVSNPYGYDSQAAPGSSLYSNSNIANGDGDTSNQQNNGGSAGGQAQVRHRRADPGGGADQDHQQPWEGPPAPFPRPPRPALAHLLPHPGAPLAACPAGDLSPTIHE